ncbi:1368_t:CDS:2, partial [Paraglomus occultum]
KRVTQDVVPIEIVHKKENIMSYTLNSMTDYTDNVESEYTEELHDKESESDNDAQDVQLYEPCPYCEEPLPSPLPPELELYLSKLQKK